MSKSSYYYLKDAEIVEEREKAVKLSLCCRHLITGDHFRRNFWFPKSTLGRDDNGIIADSWIIFQKEGDELRADNISAEIEIINPQSIN